MTTLTLFHAPPSPHSQAVRLVLAEKGVPWAGRLVDTGPRLEQFDPWYLRMNPTGAVPTLVCDGAVVTRLSRILRTLDEVAPEPAHRPEDEQGRAELVAWLERVEAVPLDDLERGPLAELGRAHARRVLLKQRWDHVELAPRYQAALTRLDRAEHGATDGALIELLDTAEAALADGRPFLMGDAWTLADAALTPTLAAVCRADQAHLVHRRQRPHLAKWWGRVRRRPSYREAEIHESTHPWTVRARIRYALPRVAVAVGALWVLWALWRRFTRSR